MRHHHWITVDRVEPVDWFSWLLAVLGLACLAIGAFQAM